MTAFTTLTSGDLDPDSPITATVAGAWYYNPISMFEGNATQKVQTAALEQTGGSEAVTSATIRAAAVDQTAIGANAVGQSELKEASGIVSTAGGAGGASLTLPGGGYGFYARTRGTDTFGRFATIGGDSSSTESWTTSYVARIVVGGSGTQYAQQYYVQASPPYDLGDGEIPLFVFVEVDKNGVVVAAYQAPEAPWHYNGPTDIAGKLGLILGADGKPIGTTKYRKRKDAVEIDKSLVAAGYSKGMTHNAAEKLGSAALSDYLAAFAAAPEIEEEITQAMKNQDMPLIPRPMEPRPSNTVIMLDPVSNFCHLIAESCKHSEFDLNTLLHNGSIIVDNTPLSRAGPPGVAVHGWRFK